MGKVQIDMPGPLAARVGRNMRKAREARGLTQEATAQIAGLSQPYYSKLELGERGVTLETLDRVAEALGTTIERLLREVK